MLSSVQDWNSEDPSEPHNFLTVDPIEFINCVNDTERGSSKKGKHYDGKGACNIKTTQKQKLHTGISR